MDTGSRERALKMFTYGLYIVAAKSGDEVAAGTISWMTQASFVPPRVMVAIRNSSRLHGVVEKSRSFAASVVSTDRRGMAASFFKLSKVEEGRLNGYSVDYGPETGAPIISDAPAWIEARVTETVAGGDHTIYVAEIVNAGTTADGAQPLVLGDTEWTYGG